MEHMEIYNKLKTPPKSALKPIKAGRLKGKTDISPQWRIQAMTETFGPCGIGWKFEITKQWIESGSDNQIFAFININLFVKDGDNWSDPIPGTGGSLLVINEKNGLYSNDEAYKMSLTDALGGSMKMLGMASDVYMGVLDNGGNNDSSKYLSDNQQTQSPQNRGNEIPNKGQRTPPEQETIWLTKDQFDAAIKSDLKGVIATINAFGKKGYAMKKDYREQLTNRLAVLKAQA